MAFVRDEDRISKSLAPRGFKRPSKSETEMNNFTFSIHTDKMPGGWHGSYCECLERLWFSLRQTTDPVLEIGVDGFGFTQTLADYFPKAPVIAVDVREIPKPEMLSPRIEFMVRDAYSLECVEELEKLGPFSVISEDGSHQLGHQEFFARHYPHLLSGIGVAIIEDIAEHSHFAILQAAVAPEFFTMAIDLTHHDNQRFDNRIMAIWRR